MSSVVCLLLTFTLIIVNAVMGIFIGLDYYLMVFAGLTVGLTFGLVLFNYKKIFFSKKKIQKSKSSVSSKVKRDNCREVVQTKRKIS